MKVRFSLSAQADLDGIYFHIAQDRPGAAGDMLLRLLDAVDDLKDFPMIGRPSGRSGERELTTVWPYVIVYVIRDGLAEVTRVYHGAQSR